MKKLSIIIVLILLFTGGILNVLAINHLHKNINNCYFILEDGTAYKLHGSIADPQLTQIINASELRNYKNCQTT